METYPIIIDGEKAGTLTVDRLGPRTVFQADCALRSDLVRISVYGGDKEGFLGLLIPEGERLRLKKTLSRGDLRAFPETIEAVERAGGRTSPPPEPDPEPECVPEPEQKSAPGPEPECVPEPEPEPVPEPCETPEAPKPAPAPEPEQSACETGEPATAEEPELAWYASPDGALVCFDGERSLIALPPEDQRVPMGVAGELRTIEGKEYLVYRTKDGRIVR